MMQAIGVFSASVDEKAPVEGSSIKKKRENDIGLTFWTTF